MDGAMDREDSVGAGILVGFQSQNRPAKIAQRVNEMGQTIVHPILSHSNVTLEGIGWLYFFGSAFTMPAVWGWPLIHFWSYGNVQSTVPIARVTLSSLFGLWFDRTPCGAGNCGTCDAPQFQTTWPQYGGVVGQMVAVVLFATYRPSSALRYCRLQRGANRPRLVLGGTFTTIQSSTNPAIIHGIATRDCTVPNGKFLYFPLLNVECSTIEGNGTTEQELRDCAIYNADHIVPSSLFLTIDGVSAKELIDFRVQSPPFAYGPLPANNVLQAFGVNAPLGATSLAVGDGVYVMLNPLPKGKHTIHFGGTAVYTSAADGFDLIFDLDITYHITVSK